MARQNRRGLELSFQKCGPGARGRWYSRQGGKFRAFGYGNGITDRPSYLEALGKFRAFQAELIPQPPANQLRPEYYEALQVWGQAETAKRQTSQSAKATMAVKTLLADYVKDQEARNNARHVVEEQGIGEISKNNISDGRLCGIKRDADDFRKAVGDWHWDGSEKTAAEIWKHWRDHYEKRLFAKEIKAGGFNEKIKFIRHLFGWAEENYKLDRLPRNLKSLVAKYEMKSTAKALPKATIHKLWDAADVREKMFIALGLNCGYYSKDISDLTGKMIEGGYIAHVRRKTGVKVRYKLWDVTRRLLKALREDTGDGRVFTSDTGKALNYYTPLKKNPDHTCRVDIVRNDFFRLLKATGVKGFSFSNLRDTATTAIENFDRNLSDLFDAHADARMAALYIDGEHVDTSGLDKGIDHLEQLYGLTWDGSMERRKKQKAGRPKKQRLAA